MTQPTLADAIAARAQAREHWECSGCPARMNEQRPHIKTLHPYELVPCMGLQTACTADHRTDAERDRDALAACADLAAWFGGMHEHWHCGYHDRRGANCSPEAIDDGFCMTNLDVAQHCTEGRIERERVAWLYDAIQRHAGGEHA